MNARIPLRFGIIKLARLSIVLALNLGLSTIGVDAQVAFSAGAEIQSVTDFYGPLSSYGGWYDLPTYGRCWRPAQVETGWRPYSVGHWEWTDCGWCWISEEPWAWACYHYGSWVYDPVYGWVWIPGTEWAPAWVVWRVSPDYDYIGWAPCDPSGVVIAPSLFVFVDTHHFRDRLRPDRLIVNNTAIVNRTRVVNNISQETRTFGGRRQRIAVNRGPGVDPIQRATGARIVPRPIEQVVTQTPAPEGARPRTPALAEEHRQPTVQATPPPAGRQEQHIYRQPAEQLPATGREEPRIYHEPPPAEPQSPAQAQPPPPSRVPPHAVVPNPATQPAVPEPKLPPREDHGAERFWGNEPAPPTAAPAPVHEAPPFPQAPSPAPDKGSKDRDPG